MIWSCTEDEFHKNNAVAYSWYFETYPFLKSFTLPISFFTLKEFYREDSKTRNLPVEEKMLQCYENVWSYFLENYPKRNSGDRLQGKSFIEKTITAVTAGVSKTFNVDIPNWVNELKYLLFIILLIVIFYFWSKIK